MSNRSSPDIEKKVPLDNGTDSTPNENDPCLKDDDTKDKKKRNFRERAEETLREKSGLSHKGLLVACVVLFLFVILLIVIIVLAACWPSTPHSMRYPVCKDADCIHAVAQVRQSLDESYSPCTDIWNWSCGGWLKIHSLPPERSHWSLYEELRKKESARIMQLIATMPVPVETQSIPWKIKNLYDSCMEVENVETDGTRPLHKIIKELGGWQVLREWSMSSWDYRRVLERLHSTYGATPFFKISVVPNPRSPATNIIKIEPSGLGLPDKSFYYLEPESKITSAYIGLIRDIVIIFKAITSDASKFSNDMFHFEKRLAEITPDTINLQDPVATNNIITVSELKITASSIPLRDILVAMFPQGKISDDTEVLVMSVEYLTAVSELISNTERSALNNYFMWTLTRAYMPYLSNDVIHALYSYTSALTGVRKPLERWEMCTQTVKRFMGLAIEAMLQNEETITDAEIKTVQHMFETLRTVAKNEITSDRFPIELEKHLRFKVLGMSLQIGLPQKTLSTEFLQKYYEKLFIQKSNLFQNIWNGFEFIEAEQQQRYIEPQTEDRTITFISKEPTGVIYSPSSNTIIVPSIFLTEPYFNSDYPKSIIYGRLGVEMAKAIASAILPYGSVWSTSSLLNQYHPAYNESLQSVREPAFCVIDLMTKNNQASFNVANLTSLDTLTHISAVKIAYKGLMDDLVGEPHVHQATLEKYEDGSMFFLTYSQSQCSLETEQYEFLQNYVQFKLTEKPRLFLTWKQVADFSRSFSCEPESQSCSTAL